MVKTTRDGNVRIEVGEVDVEIGTIAKDEELGWVGDCSLCVTSVVGTTKSAAVDLLEDHFVQAHTTPDI